MLNSSGYRYLGLIIELFWNSISTVINNVPLFVCLFIVAFAFAAVMVLISHIMKGRS